MTEDQRLYNQYVEFIEEMKKHLPRFELRLNGKVFGWNLSLEEAEATRAKLEIGRGIHGIKIVEVTENEKTDRDIIVSIS